MTTTAHPQLAGHPETRERLHGRFPADQHDPALVGPADATQGIDWNDETGAQTAEYGIVTLAAVGFAGVLAVVLASSDIKGLLLGIVKSALSFG